MAAYTENVVVASGSSIELIDITTQVKRVVERSRVKNGVAFVATKHTTSAIRLNEPCEHLITDITALLEKLVPRHGIYQHNVNSTDGRPNAHSHLMACLMGASESVPIQDGVLQLGRWQSLFFVELDGPRPERTVIITVIGE